jgi:hypothetical protein
MTYTVTAAKTATLPKRAGEIPVHDNWTAGMTDTVDDSLIHLYESHSDVFTISVRNGGTPAALEVVSGLVAVDNTENGIVHQTVFTLTNVAQAVVNGTEYQSTKLFTFPAGRIAILGSVASLAQKTTSALAGTLNASSTGAVSLGSAAASATTLDTTMVDLAPSTAFTSSATVNVAGTAVTPILAATAQLDGTATAIPVYLNSAFATTTDVDANATMTWTGKITITWINLGDV